MLETPQLPPSVTFAEWRLFIPEVPYLRDLVLGGISQFMYENQWIEGLSDVEETCQLLKEMWLTMQRVDEIGRIAHFARDNAPVGWLACDGSSYSKTDYPLLYAALGSAFIVDSDTFNVPDLRRKVIQGSGGGLSIGDANGSNTTTLTTGNLPAHTHTYSKPLPGFVDIGTGVPVNVSSDIHTVDNSSSVGSSTPLSIEQAAVVLLPCIYAGWMP